jgi:hypothetical protein
MTRIQVIVVLDVETTGDQKIAEARLVESLSKDRRVIHGIEYSAKITGVDINVRR